MENTRNKEEVKLIGLGTPATRSGIIKNLFDRGYVREEKKKLYATDKGLFLLKQLQKDEKLWRIADVGETTVWEQQLQENPGEFKKSIIEYLRSCIKQGEREHSVPPLRGAPGGRKEKLLLHGVQSGPALCVLNLERSCRHSGFYCRPETPGIRETHGNQKMRLQKRKRFTAVFIMNRDGKLYLRFPENKSHHLAKAWFGKE
jgi:hypothetical protein